MSILGKFMKFIFFQEKISEFHLLIQFKLLIVIIYQKIKYKKNRKYLIKI